MNNLGLPNMDKLCIIFVFSISLLLGCKANKKSGREAHRKVPEPAGSMHHKKGNSALIETYWKLVSLHGKHVPEQDNPREAHIILQAKRKKMIGSGGCNVLSGSYKLGENNSISFSNIATTRMSCPNLKTEQQFVKIFKHLKAYRIQSDTLLFSDGNDRILAKFKSTPGGKY